MSTTVCLGAKAIYYAEGGGHLWVYLNWALGLRALGCRVIWLEILDSTLPIEHQQNCIARLKARLARYDLTHSLALASWDERPLAPELTADCIDLEEAAGADLFLNQVYGLPAGLVARFRRSALLDIDPGLTQIWVKEGKIVLTPHDVYFTIGETVGQPGGRVPDVGLRWQYTPPCVALEQWPVHTAAADAPFTTVSHWYGGEWAMEEGELYANDKRIGFQPFLELPRHTDQRLELALCLADTPMDAEERAILRQRGWRVRDTWEVANTPWDYQSYVQSSRGEFSCTKPSCVRLANAWVSDRTLCYLASGKPAVVQHTGPSRFLPDREGLLRFRDIEEAAVCLEIAASDYERQSRLARALAEEHFNAKKVVSRVLERALS